MKKHLAYLSLAFAAIQIATYFLTFFAVIWLRSDCTFANDYQCTGSSQSQLVIPVVAFFALPPLIMKLVLRPLAYKISNRKLLIIDLVTMMLLLVLVAIYVSITQHGSGV